VAFAKAAGLSQAQLASTAVGAPTDPVWGERDALLLRLVDELHDTASVSEALWGELSARWSPPELLELLVMAGWYRLLSGVINAVALPLESWAARFPGR
jgi:4-carboxymuconolactone decarboxylase